MPKKSHDTDTYRENNPWENVFKAVTMKVEASLIKLKDAVEKREEAMYVYATQLE